MFIFIVFNILSKGFSSEHVTLLRFCSQKHRFDSLPSIESIRFLAHLEEDASPGVDYCG